MSGVTGVYSMQRRMLVDWSIAAPPLAELRVPTSPSSPAQSGLALYSHACCDTMRKARK
jgi:hypothetical protein